MNQKFSVIIHRQMIAVLAPYLIHGFQAGDKLQVFKFVFLIEPIDISNFPGVFTGNDAKNVVVHMILIEKPCGGQNPLSSAGAHAVYSV